MQGQAVCYGQKDWSDKMAAASSKSPQRMVTAAERKPAANSRKWPGERGRRPRALSAYLGDWRAFAQWCQRGNAEPLGLAHLRVEDVKLSKRKGTVLGRGEHAKRGKRRQVPLLLEARKRMAACLDAYPTGQGPLFLGQRGPLGEDAAARVVKEYAAWTVLEGATPHVLRHTSGYVYLEKAQNDLVGPADILGHVNLTATQIYTRKPLGALQDEIEKPRFLLGTLSVTSAAGSARVGQQRTWRSDVWPWG